MEPLPTEEPLETVLVVPTALPAAAPPRPRIWTVLLAVPAYAVASLVAAGVLAAFGFLSAGLPMGPGGGAGPEQLEALLLTPRFLLASLLVQCAIAYGIAVVASGLSREPLQARLALVRPALGAGALALASLGLPLVGSAMEELLRALGVPVTGVLAQLERVVHGLSPAQLATALVAGGVIVPIGEELFFRGYVQSRLCRRWGTWGGIVFTAFFFGLAHFDLAHSAMAFVAGLYLGWLARRTGSTVPGMIVHAVNNLLAIAATWAIPDAPMTRTAHAVLLASLLAAAAAVIAWLARRLPRAGAEPPAPEPTPESENAATLGG